MGISARPRLRFAGGHVFQFRIELVGVTPVVWRRVGVSSRASLHELHGVVQRAYGLHDADAYCFEVDGVRYHDPDELPMLGPVTADAVAIDSLELHPGHTFRHLAETGGEPWQHRVTLEQVTPRLVGQRLPACMAGERAAPPDDCDGPVWYMALLNALETPLDPRAAELREWLPDDFDPEWVDITAINAQLARLPKHRPA